MCLVVPHFELRVRKADKPIKVKKVLLANSLFSPYKNFKYELNKEAESEIKIVKSLYCFIISEGLHSFNYDTEFRIDPDNYLIPEYEGISYHTRSFSGGALLKVFDATIPIGSKYIEYNGCIVSDRLIIN